MLRLLEKDPNLFYILKLKSILDFRFKYFGFLEKKSRRYKTYEWEENIFFLSNRILFILFM